MNEEVVDNLGHIKHEDIDDDVEKTFEDENQGLMPDCPPPNVTYNGSLLSSGEVNMFSIYFLSDIFYKKLFFI